MKRLLILGAITPLIIGGVAMAAKPDKVNLCHLTHSESNMWVTQQVNANEVQSHLDNGDKLYNGAVDDKGRPTDDAWCSELHVDTPPEVTPTTPVTPTVTEIVNIEGK